MPIIQTTTVKERTSLVLRDVFSPTACPEPAEGFHVGFTFFALINVTKIKRIEIFVAG